MADITYARGIYITGIDPKNCDPEEFIQQKIGQANNNHVNRKERLSERQRHVPGAMEHEFFPTHQGDKLIREYLCSKFPMQFRPNMGAGHDVIDLKAKDFSFLIEQTTRYFNDVNIGNTKQHSFSLRAEQDAFLLKAIAFFSNPDNLGREFLADAKMRFGKTHSSYELIMRMDLGLILILTGRPTDTKKAWLDAIDHVDFDFDQDDLIDASKQGDVPITIDPNKRRTIIFASLQDFARNSEDGVKEKFKHFHEMTFDLLIKDECHLAFDTANTKAAIAKLSCKHILNLSGTPYRALLEERFDDDAKFTWSYIDEQRARAKEIIELGQDEAEKGGQYYWLCPMKIFTILLSPELYKDANLFTEEEGFTFTKLFSVDENNGKCFFRNDVAVKAFINALCHGVVMPYSDQAHNAHQYKSINLKHSLWYVPGVREANLLAAMLKQHDIFKAYDIVIAAGNNGGEGNETVTLVKNRIADIETGRNRSHIGTITLSCGKISHGVSIPELGSVFNLSDMKSAQLYFQLIFRGQTPWVGKKHECYVFDFNPNRTLEHIHTVSKAGAGTGDVRKVLSEMLDVFNVICYNGTEFNRMNADELISKLETGFGRGSSLEGLQSLLSNMEFEIDEELLQDMVDVEFGVAVKSKVEVNRNDNVPNGKNTKRPKNDDDKDDDDTDNIDDNDDIINDKNKEELFDEQLIERTKAALRTIPLYWAFTGDDCYDTLMTNLTSKANSQACKDITGLSGHKLRKILSSQSEDKKRMINQGIMRFRGLEIMDQS